ncbi:ErfK/YbiS/YcfS/YnhG family protein [Chitinispirillum alkaliphilum]|nr:ErfK/YbiS/YcfS/YnhG family protein [Chitinispirillum alkaliphilum]
MLEKIKTTIAFKIKELEFRYNTWKKARDIRKAYAHKAKFKLPDFKPYLRKALYPVSVTIIVLLIGLGLWKWVPMIPFAQIHQSVQSGTEKVFSSIGSLADGARESIRRSREREVRISQNEPNIADDQNVEDYGVVEVYDNTELTEQESIAEEATAFERFFSSLPRENISDQILFADKEKQTLYVIEHNSGNWDIVRDYHITSGEVEGPKQIEHDRKTPQGLYFLVGRKDRSDLTEIYGPVAFVLNYPNSEDREAGRTGSGIWIHGTERDNSPPEPTRGCISLANHDVAELGTILRIGYGIPIVISCGTEEATFEEDLFSQMAEKREYHAEKYRTHSQYFENFVLQWRDAWQSKDIDHYTTFYATGIFRSGRSDWNAFRNTKIRTFNMYDTIKISIDHFMLTELSETEAVVKFFQDYETNLNRFLNGKRLILVKDGDRWLISRESTFPQQELFL